MCAVGDMAKAARAQCTLEYKDLKEIMKLAMTEPGDVFHYGDDIQVLKKYKDFFLLVAGKTNRLNSVSLSKCAVDLFAMANHEAAKFGNALTAAYAHCKRASEKAADGSKLDKTLLEIYSKMQGTLPKPKVEPKEEPLSPPPAKKIKSEPGKHLQAVLSSPSAVLDLYKGYKGVKMEQVREIIYIYIYMCVLFYKSFFIYIYIYIYIYVLYAHFKSLCRSLLARRLRAPPPS